MIKYSVVIPVYNLENYIEDTLDSLASIPDNTELVIVDDGSTDSTRKVIKEYISSHYISNVQLLTQHNGGVSIARNTGIEAAKGEYLVFIDGDDLCSGGLVEVMDKHALSSPDMMVWRFYTVNGDEKKVSQAEFSQNEYTGKDFCKTLLKGINRIRIGSFAVRKDLVERVGLRYTEGCEICEDVEFMYKSVLSSDRIVTANDICYEYIRREGSAMNTYDMRKFQAPKAIQRIYGFAALQPGGIEDEYLEDSLKYGLYITHCMYGFDSSCRYLDTDTKRKDFIRCYLREYGDIESYIKKAKRQMRYKPEIYSKGRLALFLFNRRIYTRYVSRKFKRSAG